jgi:hypothetical protein
MIFIFNEWLIHDLKLDNGEENHVQAYSLLEKLEQKQDQFVFGYNGVWAKKVFSLCSSTDNLIVLRAAKKLFSLIKNQVNCIILDPQEICSIPEEISNAIEEKKDYYLVEYFITARADKIITTDIPLYDALINLNIPCQMRDIFLGDYL